MRAISVFRRWGAPIGMVVLAAAAFAAAWATSSQDSPEDQSERPAARLELSGTFPGEQGPDALTWMWMGDFAVVDVTGHGRFWLGFRALSIKRPRALVLSRSGRKTLQVMVGTAPRTHLVGPIEVSGHEAIGLRPRPPASTASGRDRRELSVFLSSLRLSPRPVAALPGSGFWSGETGTRGALFNWLRDDDGTIELRAAHASSDRAWISFSAVSIARGRTLTIRGRGTVEEIQVRTTPRRFTVGPYRLLRSAARLRVSVSPGAGSYGADPRELSVRISSLEAFLSPRHEG